MVLETSEKNLKNGHCHIGKNGLIVEVSAEIDGMVTSLFSTKLEKESLQLGPQQIVSLPPQAKSVTISAESVYHADCDWVTLLSPFDPTSLRI